MEYSSKLTSKGQTTIPKEIRSLLNLEKDVKVVFTIRDDGSVTIKRKFEEGMNDMTYTVEQLKTLSEVLKKKVFEETVKWHLEPVLENYCRVKEVDPAIKLDITDELIHDNGGKISIGGINGEYERALDYIGGMLPNHIMDAVISFGSYRKIAENTGPEEANEELGITLTVMKKRITKARDMEDEMEYLED